MDAGAETLTDTADLDALLELFVPDAIARFNDEYADTVHFIGRTLGGGPDATSVRVAGLDRTGVDLVVASPGEDRSLRLDFDQPIGEVTEITARVYGLAQRARRHSGVAGSTSFERTMAEVSACGTRLVEVTGVGDVHPHLRSVSFAGEDLADLVLPGPDTFLYVLLPPPGRDELTIGRDFAFGDLSRMDPTDQPVGAYYTVRRFDPATRTLEMLFVLHDDDDADHAIGSGTASRWARGATVGDRAALWGPRTSWNPPPGTDVHVLVADETGLPAAAGILEALSPETSVYVFAEVADMDQRQELPRHPGATITWLSRDGAAPGTTPLLEDAVRSMDWPVGNLYVWGGGESRTMTAIRKYVRGERGLPRDAVSLVAYWRRSD